MAERRVRARLVMWLGAGMLALPLPGLQAQPSVVAHTGAMAPVAPGERLENLDTLRDKLKAYHACSVHAGCYAKDLDLQAARALAYLKRRAAHPGDDTKLALVLDIDETTLTNWTEMEKAGFAYRPAEFNAWVENSNAPAIPGTLRLVQAAHRLGVSVFFLTGRPESQRAATERNLKAEGFGPWQELILRGRGQENSTALQFKSAERARIEAEGYRIVLNVGDQWTDLRGKPMAEYSVKYPDPYYFLR